VAISSRWIKLCLYKKIHSSSTFFSADTIHLPEGPVGGLVGWWLVKMDFIAHFGQAGDSQMGWVWQHTEFQTSTTYPS